MDDSRASEVEGKSTLPPEQYKEGVHTNLPAHREALAVFAEEVRGCDERRQGMEDALNDPESVRIIRKWIDDYHNDLLDRWCELDEAFVGENPKCTHLHLQAKRDPALKKAMGEELVKIAEAQKMLDKIEDDLLRKELTPELEVFIQRNMCSVAKRSELPVVDGHFWIERDGVIIDPTFPEYDIIRRLNGCTSVQKHQKAPQWICDRLFNRYMKCYQEAFGEDEWTDTLYPMFLDQPRYSCAVQNVMADVAYNGGNVCFGSMGWERNNKKKGTFWEYGCEEWTTLNDYLKMKTPSGDKIRLCEVCLARCDKGCGCGRAFYCSKECQKTDWKGHKQVCKAVKK